MSEQSPDAITCRELVELVTDYFEGALVPRDRDRFEQHLGGCVSCLTYLAQMRTTREVLGRLREDDLPAEAQAALLGAFRRWHAP